MYACYFKIIFHVWHTNIHANNFKGSNNYADLSVIKFCHPRVREREGEKENLDSRNENKSKIRAPQQLEGKKNQYTATSFSKNNPNYSWIKLSRNENMGCLWGSLLSFKIKSSKNTITEFSKYLNKMNFLVIKTIFQ